MAPKQKDTSKISFSFDTVAVLVAALKSTGHTLGMKDYKKMAALDSSKTASSFDHQFREVKQRAAELLTNSVNDDSTNGTPKTPKSGAKSSGQKRKSKEDAMNGASQSDEDMQTPSKKVKKEPKNEDSDSDDDDSCGIFQ